MNSSRKHGWRADPARTTRTIRRIWVWYRRLGSPRIREFLIDRRGLTLGGPLTNFQGVLSGVPALVGEEAQLLKAEKS